MSESSYHPSLFATYVGGAQWGIPAPVVAVVLLYAHTEYLLATGNEISIEFLGLEALFVVAALVVGAVLGGVRATLRTESREAEVRTTRQRIEFLAIFIGLCFVVLPLTMIRAPLAPLPQPQNLLLSALWPVVCVIGGLLLALILVYRRGFDRLTGWGSFGP